MSFISRLFALFKKDFRLALSYKGPFIFQFFGGIFQILLFFFISDYINILSEENSTSAEDNYFTYVVLGICFVEVVSTMVRATPMELSNLKNSGVLEEIMQLPSGNIILLFGSNLYPMFISLLKIIIYLCLAFILSGETLFSLQYIFPFILTLITFIFSLILIGLIGAAYTLLFFRAGLVSSIFIGFSIFLGEAFFPSNLFFEPVQKLSYLTSLTPSLSNFRMIISSQFDLYLFVQNIVHILILSFSYGLIALISLKYSIKYSKKNGTLLHY